MQEFGANDEHLRSDLHVLSNSFYPKSLIVKGLGGAGPPKSLIVNDLGKALAEPFLGESLFVNIWLIAKYVPVHDAEYYRPRYDKINFQNHE